MSNLLPSLETFAKTTMTGAAATAAFGFGLLYYGQNFLIYPSAFPHGSREDVPVPSDFGLPYDDLKLTTPDNITIRAYLIMQQTTLDFETTGSQIVEVDETDEEFASRRPTIIMFHGNGGNHGHRIPLAKVFYAKMRCNVIMPSYRGYGHSEGSPSEKGIRIDAQTTLDYVLSHPVLSKTQIIIYGQSLGGAVTIDLASRNPTKISALILENTFLSIPRLVPATLPFLSPFTFLCHQKWDSASKVALLPLDMGILMLSGVVDQVVPREQMKELWEIVEKRSEGKEVAEVKKTKFMEFPYGSHNDTCIQPGYWAAVAQFVSEVGKSKL